jgi:hypothetical protein
MTASFCFHMKHSVQEDRERDLLDLRWVHCQQLLRWSFYTREWPAVNVHAKGEEYGLGRGIPGMRQVTEPAQVVVSIRTFMPTKLSAVITVGLLGTPPGLVTHGGRSQERAGIRVVAFCS